MHDTMMTNNATFSLDAFLASSVDCIMHQLGMWNTMIHAMSCSCFGLEMLLIFIEDICVCQVRMVDCILKLLEAHDYLVGWMMVLLLARLRALLLPLAEELV